MKRNYDYFVTHTLAGYPKLELVMILVLSFVVELFFSWWYEKGGDRGSNISEVFHQFPCQQFLPVSIQQALMRWWNIRWRSAKCWWLICLERFHAPRYIPFENGGLISHQNEAASDSITEAPKSIGWSKHGVISGVAHPNRVLRYKYIYIWVRVARSWPPPPTPMVWSPPIPRSTSSNSSSSTSTSTT